MAARIPNKLKDCGVDVVVPMTDWILRSRIVPTGNQLLCNFPNFIRGIRIASSECLMLEKAC